MAITGKLTLRYQRRAGFPGYSHIEMETVEEIVLEEGDDATEVRRGWFEQAAREMVERIEPVAQNYRRTAPKPTEKKAPEQEPGKEPARRRGKKPVALKPRSPEGGPKQTELEQPPLLADMPAKRTPGRPMPEYDDAGNRLRTVAQKGFSAAELNSAWRALLDVGVVEGEISFKRQDNDKRKNIRDWMLLSPMDPGFSQAELQWTAEQYLRYREQGNNAVESMREVANDYAITFSENAPAQAEGAGEPGAGSEAPPGGEDEAEPDDQGDGDSAGDAESGDDEPDAGGGDDFGLPADIGEEA